MRTFETRPNNGTSIPWAVDITVGTCLRIQQQTGVNLYDNPLGIPADIEKLEDAATLVAVLYSICHEQAMERDITFQSFADQITGDVAKKATSAAMEELADFFTALVPVKGELFRKIWRQSQTIEAKMEEALSADLDYSTSSI